MAASILELIANGIPLYHAAAAAGIATSTLKDWLAIGGRISADIALRRRTRTSLTPHEQACWEFSDATTQVRAVWVAHRLGIINHAADTGRTLTKTVTRTSPDGAVETTVTVEELGPNVAANTWLLSHALPDEFGPQRLEVSGPEGGPVHVAVDVSDLVANARAFLESRAEARAAIEIGTVSGG